MACSSGDGLERIQIVNAHLLAVCLSIYVFEIIVQVILLAEKLFRSMDVDNIDFHSVSTHNFLTK